MYHLPLTEENTQRFSGVGQSSWPGCRPRLTGRSVPHHSTAEQVDELSGLGLPLFLGPSGDREPSRV